MTTRLMKSTLSFRYPSVEGTETRSVGPASLFLSVYLTVLSDPPYSLSLSLSLLSFVLFSLSYPLLSSPSRSSNPARPRVSASWRIHNGFAQSSGDVACRFVIPPLSLSLSPPLCLSFSRLSFPLAASFGRPCKKYIIIPRRG